MKFLELLGCRIKDLRIKKGFTQEELAKKVGYTSRSTINKIEKGLVDISQTKILELSNILECSPAYLMYDYDNIQKYTLLDNYTIMANINGVDRIYYLNEEDFNTIVKLLDKMKEVM